MIGPRVSDSNRGLLPYLALVGLALIWGVSFLFIKVAVHDMSPIALVLIRSTSGCIALALIVRAMGRPLFGEGWRQRLIPFAILGITGGLLPWAGIAWGETRISSGLASILNSTTPLWTAVLVYWVIPSDRPSALNYAGVLIGLAGAVIALGVGGSAIGLLLYFYILNKLGPVQATGVTLLVPVTAVIWGVILLREVVTLPIIIGMVVILTGIVLTNVRARKPKQVTEKEPAAA